VVTRLTAALVLAATLPLHGQRLPDLAIMSAMQSGEPSMAQVRVWRRVEVPGDLDLVVAVGTHESPPVQP
jgi:hypothetical protein